MTGMVNSVIRVERITRDHGEYEMITDTAMGEFVKERREYEAKTRQIYRYGCDGVRGNFHDHDPVKNKSNVRNLRGSLATAVGDLKA